MVGEEKKEVSLVESLENIEEWGKDFGVSSKMLELLTSELAKVPQLLEEFKQNKEQAKGFLLRAVSGRNSGEKKQSEKTVGDMEALFTFFPKEIGEELDILIPFIENLREEILHVKKRGLSPTEAVKIFTERFLSCVVLFHEFLNQEFIQILHEKSSGIETIPIPTELIIPSLKNIGDILSFPKASLTAKFNFFLTIGRDYDSVKKTKKKAQYLSYFNLLLFRETFAALSFKESLIRFPNSLWEDWLSLEGVQKNIADENSKVSQVFLSLWGGVPFEDQPLAVQKVLAGRSLVDKYTKIFNAQSTEAVLEKQEETDDEKLARELNIAQKTRETFEFHAKDTAEKWGEMKKSLSLIQNNPDSIGIILFLEEEVLIALRQFLLFLPCEYRREMGEFESLFEEMGKVFSRVDLQCRSAELDRVKKEDYDDYRNVPLPEGGDDVSEKQRKEIQRIIFEGGLEVWNRIMCLSPLLSEYVENKVIPFDVVDREGKCFPNNKILVDSNLKETAGNFFKEYHSGKMPAGDIILGLYFLLAKTYSSSAEKDFFLEHLNNLLYREQINAFSMSQHLRNLPEELWEDWLKIYGNLIFQEGTQIRKLFVSLWKEYPDCPNSVRVALQAIGEYVSKKDLFSVSYGSLKNQLVQTDEERFFGTGGSLEEMEKLFFKLATRKEYRELTKRGKDKNRVDIYCKELSVILMRRDRQELSFLKEKIRKIPNVLWRDWVARNKDSLTGKKQDSLKSALLFVWDGVVWNDLPQALRPFFPKQEEKNSPPAEITQEPESSAKKTEQEELQVIEPIPHGEIFAEEEVNEKCSKPEKKEEFNAPVIEHDFENGNIRFKIINYSSDWHTGNVKPLILLRLWKARNGGWKGVGNGNFYIEINENGECILPAEAVRDMKKNTQHKAIFFLVPESDKKVPDNDGTEIVFEWGKKQQDKANPVVIEEVVDREGDNPESSDALLLEDFVGEIGSQVDEKISIPEETHLESHKPGDNGNTPPEAPVESLSWEDQQVFLNIALEEYDGEFVDIIEVDEDPSLETNGNEKIFQFHFTEDFLSNEAGLDNFPAIKISFGSFKKVAEPGYLKIAEPEIGDGELQEKIITEAINILSTYEISEWEKGINETKAGSDVQSRADRFREFQNLQGLVKRGALQQFVEKNLPTLLVSLENAEEPFYLKTLLQGSGTCQVEVTCDKKLKITLLKRYEIFCFYEDGVMQIEFPPGILPSVEKKLGQCVQKIFSVLMNHFVLETDLRELRKEVYSYSTLPAREAAWKAIANGEGRRLVFKNGEFVAVERGMKLEDYKEKDFVLVRDLVIQFPTGEAEYSEIFPFDPLKYSYIREYIQVPRNKKYLVARIISTAKDKCGIGGRYKDKRPIGSDKVWALLQETFEEAGITAEMVANVKRVGDLLKLNLRANGQDWIDYFLQRMEQEEVPVGLDDPHIVKMGDLKTDAQKNEWAGVEAIAD